MEALMPKKKSPSKIEIQGDVALVHLTRGYIARVDRVDLHLVHEHHWSAQVLKDGHVYALRGISTAGKPSMIYMHRLISRAPRGMLVDHMNRDTLDNRRGNLRLATNAQNQANRRLSKNNTSGVKGVSWYEGVGKWVAHITVDRRRIHLGHHDTIEAAARAREAAEIRYQGEFRWNPNLHECKQEATYDLAA
jgi:hypothetical protein